MYGWQPRAPPPPASYRLLSVVQIVHMLLSSQQASDSHAEIIIKMLQSLSADGAGYISRANFTVRAVRGILGAGTGAQLGPCMCAGACVCMRLQAMSRRNPTLMLCFEKILQVRC